MALVLGTYSMKYIFVPQKGPGMKELGKAAWDFAQKLRWQWVHRHGRRERSRTVCRGAPPVPCREVVAPEIVGACAAMHEAVVQLYGRNISRQSTKRRSNASSSSISNMCRFHKHDLKAVPTDKDGTFALVPKNDLIKFIVQKMPKERYLSTHLHQLDFGDLRRGFLRHATRVSDALERPELLQQMRRSLNTSRLDDCIAQIQYTVKTRKDPGQVGLRIIHGCARNPFRSLARVLMEVLENQLEGVQHICRSSIDFNHNIASLRVGPDDRFCRLDLEDFYMASGHEILSRHAFDQQAHNAGEVYKEALGWLLEGQRSSVRLRAACLGRKRLGNQPKGRPAVWHKDLAQIQRRRFRHL